MMTLAQAESRSRDIVNDWAVAAAAISWIPGSSLALGAADWNMISRVANSFEVHTYSKEGVLGVIGACLTGKMAAEALSFIPIFGWVAKAAIASGITKAMGEAVIAYFRERSPLKQGLIEGN